MVAYLSNLHVEVCESQPPAPRSLRDISAAALNRSYFHFLLGEGNAGRTGQQFAAHRREESPQPMLHIRSKNAI